MTKRRRGHEADDDYGYGYGYFPPSRPIRTDKGIQSRSQRGAFAANWWAKRWLAVLESYGIGSRLQRGRSYARSGQVLNVDVQPGLVEARVQGSRPMPYAVEINVRQMPDGEWERALDAISEQAIFSAQLLDGEMPQDIESVFQSARISLFPASERDLTTTCSCPDYANPCKHIAAVYYLLGEQFDRDPFLIFTLRGRTREQVMEGLRRRRAAAVQTEAAADAPTERPAPPLDADLSGFWGEALHEWTAPDFSAPAIDAALLRRLGAPPGDTRKALEDLYRAMTAHVQERVFGGDDEAP